MYQTIAIFQKSSCFLELELILSSSEGISFNYFKAVSNWILLGIKLSSIKLGIKLEP